ncbi:MAG TPA: ornithine carbamoyltransferase [Alphaproteobacteria bacterium]|nr:ornithine carbamoyltransferase [Alphaproteobacteria bacterium]
MASDVRHFINLTDFDPQVLKDILKNAHNLKAKKFNPPQLFKGLSLAMMFDKLSTRTRMSFDVAMKQLGGHTIVMSKGDMQLGGAESVESTAKVMSRYVDAIMIRMSDHKVMEELASYSDIPIINGMTNDSHPCQIMADMMTIEEKLGSIAGKKIAWFGDDNNVSKTYEQAAPIFGFDFVMATPFNDVKPEQAAKDADVIVTDTWVSLGQDGKAIEKFWPYQVNGALMALAKPTAIFMHCLPIHEWEEVTEEVAKGPHSVIYDEAENRLHAQKAILAWCLENAGVNI